MKTLGIREMRASSEMLNKALLVMQFNKAIR